MSDLQPESRSYRADALSGGRWGAVRSVVLQAASILTTAVLARILSDVEFGLVAVTVIVLTMFDLITRVGFGASVIRQESPTERSNSTFFWASVVLGLVAGVTAALVSTPAARLAGSEEAAPLIVLAAATLPINLASRVPHGLLSREFRFRTLAGVDIAGSVTHGVVAIGLALAGFGAWAVVVGQVTRAVMVLGASIIASGFRPRASVDRSLLRQELSFNVSFLGGDLITYANKNADYWFVGNRLGTAQLGVYYVAYVLPNLLRQRITIIGHDIMYPLVARITDDLPRIRSAFLRIAGLVSYLVLPAMFGLAVLADLAIRIGFGPEWEDAVGPLRVIAVASGVSSMTVVGSGIFPARGRPIVTVWVGFFVLVVLITGLAFSWDSGTLMTVSYAVLAAAIASAVLLLLALRREIGLSIAEFARTVAPFLTMAIVMAAAVWATRAYVIGNLGPVLEAAIGVAVGAVIYLGLGRLLFRKDFADQYGSLRALLGRDSQDS